MIYLACPYSHPDAAVRLSRFQAANIAAARLMRAGEIVFSPISHSHPMVEHGLPGDWEFWERFDRIMLRACCEMVVLAVDGWEESRGVAAEIRLADEMDIPIRMWDPSGPVFESRTARGAVTSR